MNITLLTYGSRGDAQPFVALGVGLKKTGHRVVLAAPAMFEDFVTSHGLEFAPLPGNPAELSRLLVDEAQGNPFKMVSSITRFALPLAVEVMRSVRAACADADAIVHSFLMTLAGHPIARKRGIPDYAGETFPSFASSSYFPAVGAAELPIGAPYNRFTHTLTNSAFLRISQVANASMQRKHPDLFSRHIDWPFTASKGRPATPILLETSPRVFPPPPDWPAYHHVTGYWFLNDADDYQPPDDLARFLADGPPPVYIGFGSTVTRHAEKLGRIATQALERAGLRGILLGGWSGIASDAPISPNILRIDSAPHDWLFPRMAAVVHHGGAGTTAAGLKAGVPGLLTPFSSDQPFWAGRVKRLSVAPDPIPFGKLTADNLAEALHQAVTDQPMRQRAAKLGEQIRAEDGVARAVEIIERGPA